jgi:hypothetical protein
MSPELTVGNRINSGCEPPTHRTRQAHDGGLPARRSTKLEQAVLEADAGIQLA